MLAMLAMLDFSKIGFHNSYFIFPILVFSPVEWNQPYYESEIFTEREKQVYRNTHYRMLKSIIVLFAITYYISGAFCELFSQVQYGVFPYFIPIF